MAEEHEERRGKQSLTSWVLWLRTRPKPSSTVQWISLFCSSLDHTPPANKEQTLRTPERKHHTQDVTKKDQPECGSLGWVLPLDFTQDHGWWEAWDMLYVGCKWQKHTSDWHGVKGHIGVSCRDTPWHIVYWCLFSLNIRLEGNTDAERFLV